MHEHSPTQYVLEFPLEGKTQSLVFDKEPGLYDFSFELHHYNLEIVYNSYPFYGEDTSFWKVFEFRYARDLAYQRIRDHIFNLPNRWFITINSDTINRSFLQLRQSPKWGPCFTMKDDGKKFQIWNAYFSDFQSGIIPDYYTREGYWVDGTVSEYLARENQ